MYLPENKASRYENGPKNKKGLIEIFEITFLRDFFYNRN